MATVTKPTPVVLTHTSTIAGYSDSVLIFTPFKVMRFFIADEHMDGAVNSRARIPTAVGLVGVTGNYAHFVILSVF